MMLTRISYIIIGKVDNKDLLDDDYNTDIQKLKNEIKIDKYNIKFWRKNNKWKYDNRKKADKLIRSSAAEYLTYVAAAGENGVELRYEDENIWLTQKNVISIIWCINICN